MDTPLVKVPGYVVGSRNFIIENSNSIYELVSEVLSKQDEIIDRVNELDLDKEDINDLTNTRKLSASGDFTGTLNGYPISQTDVGLSTTVDGIEISVSSLQTNLTQLQTNQSSDHTNVTTLQGQMVTADNNISALQTNQASDQSNIATLQGQAATASSNISTLQTNQASDHSNITTLQGQMATATNNISTLQTNQATNSNNISTVQGNIDNLTTLINKNNYPVYNIKGYGAVGDGVTDDTQVIKDTLALIGAAGGGVLFFPSGIYRITSQIPVTQNNLIITGNISTLFMSYTTDAALLLVSGQNIRIDNLVFNSQSAYARNFSGSFIFTNNAQNLVIDNCQFFNCPSACVHIRTDSTNISVTNCFIKDSKADGIHVVNGSNNVIVANNTLINTGDDSISVVWYDDGDVAPNHIIITSNLVLNSQKRGINIAHGKHVLVESNYITDAVSHGILVFKWTRVEYSEDITIANNKIETCGKSAGNHGIVIGQVTRCTVKDNVIDSPFSDGILFYEYSLLKIIGNSIRNCGGYGIHAMDSIALVTTTNLSIINNDIDTVQNTAIYLYPLAPTSLVNVDVIGNIVRGNDVLNSSPNYITIRQASSLNIYDNFNNGPDAVFYDQATCSSVLSKNNTPNSAGTDGLWVAYNPTVTTATGAVTAFTATGKYTTIGKTCIFNASVTVTTNGTGAGEFRISIPFPANSLAIVVGRETMLTGTDLTGSITMGNPTYAAVYKYNNDYPATDGAVIRISGSYEMS